MANRVIIGQRGTDVGMWVSKPSRSATSTVSEDLLVDTTRTMLQPFMAGTINQPSLPFQSGSASAGYAVYYKDYFFKSDQTSLGYIPICHFSISSSVAGEVYPTIKIDNTKIRLYYQETWQKNDVTAHSNIYTDIFGRQTQGAWYAYTMTTDPGKPGSLSYSCSIYYVIYKQASGLIP